MADLDAIMTALAPHGLIVRGVVMFDPAEAAQIAIGGGKAAAVVLVGHGGPSNWSRFLAWRAARPLDISDPLDTWSREVIDCVAHRFGASTIYPNDRPYHPFQQWAMRAEGLKPSPLGILMHPRFGLWHAYRGALAFETWEDQPRLHEPSHLCDGCIEKPCLKSCPVGAHGARGFDHAGCLAHVKSGRGTPCREEGCFDRNACPYGVAYRYPHDMQAFHMAAFAR